jgi:hypothetical protein
LPRPIVDPEDPWRQDAVLVAQLKKMFGGNDWKDEQIDTALDEIDRETDAMMRRALVRVRPAPEPQQLALFRSTHWLKQADNQLIRRVNPDGRSGGRGDRHRQSRPALAKSPVFAGFDPQKHVYRLT